MASPSPYRVVRVEEHQRQAGAARLVGGQGRDPEVAGKRFLTSAHMHGIDLTHFWGSVAGGVSAMGSGGRVVFRQVCLAVPGSGRTAMFFTSGPRDSAEQDELGAVIASAACDAGQSGVKLGQALLEPSERGAMEAFVAGGFQRLTTLVYLRRVLPSSEAGGARGWPEGIEVSRWASGDDAAVLRAMERSYEGTLDCPELCGMRETADVLASHKAAGKFDPSCWWVIRLGGEAAGVMLFNPSPELDSVELVYLGLAPELRGKGLAKQLMEKGLDELRGRREHWLTCAVDVRNGSAWSLYARLGFSEFARREAFVKPL
ncbi:MAG TPA: GNAT family N-acetyltransferase [Phycisphaerales bacterium]|nr:GNAT family N-acetyltransferase [Phycisphaerales bacterium]